MGYIGETTQTPQNIKLAYARAQGADVLYGGYLIEIDELEDSFEKKLQEINILRSNLIPLNDQIYFNI